MKYIIIETSFKLPAAIIFNEALQHDEVAGNKKVLSAGFCHLLGRGEVTVWGHSESLKIESSPTDAAHIKLAISLTVQ